MNFSPFYIVFVLHFGLIFEALVKLKVKQKNTNIENNKTGVYGGMIGRGDPPPPTQYQQRDIIVRHQPPLVRKK